MKQAHKEREVTLLRQRVALLAQTVDLLAERLDEAEATMNYLRDVFTPPANLSSDIIGEAFLTLQRQHNEKQREEQSVEEELPFTSFDEPELPFDSAKEEIFLEEDILNVPVHTQQLVLDEIGPTLCRVDGCEKEIHSKGFCTSHYSRNHRYGDPLYEPPKHKPVKKKQTSQAKKRKKKTLCTYGDCRAEHSAKGYCQSHYNALRNYGDPSITREMAKAAKDAAKAAETFESVEVSEPIRELVTV